MDALLTHENADFDAIAALGTSTLLYPEAIALAPRRLNRNVRDFLNLHGDIFPFTSQDQAPRKRFKVVLLVDTQLLPSARGLAKSVQVHVIDHHPPARALPSNFTFVGDDVGATTTLLVELVREKNLTLTPPQATLLLLGIYEDTGSLSYSNTDARDLAAGAWLLGQGASLELLGRFLHQPLDEAQRRLYDQLIKNAETHEIAGHSIVIAAARAPAYVEEISTLAHRLRELYDPAALFTLVHMDRQVQIVARSDRDSIDVGDILRTFRGGGHPKAAAALLRNTTLRSARARLLQALREKVQAAYTVRDIMSYGPRALEPSTTIAEAAEIAQRWGHEGFPIVRKDKLVGVLTRREIDRALHHKLQNTPVKNYMSAPVFVAPQDTIERLQQVMMESGLGQVPVLEGKRMVGIVTRTDVLKLVSTTGSNLAQAADIAERLDHALPAEWLRLLREVAATARELNFSLYLVGGLVRDLLLGHANLDLDLVVEGDAIALGNRLVEKYGGRVHGHARFGTAKWILRLESRADNPREALARLPALDLVTARTEFYEYPTALPEVERSSIKQDLHRRDFTINTMAIYLDPERYGQLLDPYGGQADLTRGLIRVLHNLSFIEDPTRILRAVRFEQRFRFQIETRTAELIRNALDLIDRVSGVRVQHEFFLLLAEAEPEHSILRLSELGVLDKIHPALASALSPEPSSNGAHPGETWFAEKARRLRERVPAPISPRLYLGLLVYRLTLSDVQALAERLRLAKDETRALEQTVALRGLESALATPDLKSSLLNQLLERFDVTALTVAFVAAAAPLVCDRIHLYLTSLRTLEPLLTGHDLQQLGIPSGPRYRQLLATLRGLQLDGLVRNRAEAEAWARQAITEAPPAHDG